MAHYTPYKMKEKLEAQKAKQAPKDMDSWDPMKEDYEDEKFNRYDRGPGRNLPSKSDTPSFGEQKSCRLYIRGIPNEIQEEGFRNMFMEYGDVIYARKMTSKIPNSNSTYGFITYRTAREGTEAIAGLDRKTFKGGEVVMRIEFARSKEQLEEERREREYNENLMRGVFDTGGLESNEEFQPRDNFEVTIDNNQRTKLETRTNGHSSGYNSDVASIPSNPTTPPPPVSPGRKSPGNTRVNPKGNPRDDDTASVTSPIDTRRVVLKSSSIEDSAQSNENQKEPTPEKSLPDTTQLASQQRPESSGTRPSLLGPGPQMYAQRGGFNQRGGLNQSSGFNQWGGPNQGGGPMWRGGFNQHGRGRGYDQYRGGMGRGQPGYYPTPDPFYPDPTFGAPPPFPGYNRAPGPYSVPYPQHPYPPPVQPLMGYPPPVRPHVPAPRHPASRAQPCVCVVCQKEATNKCSRCKSAWYCSTECQNSDWANHKLHCTAPPPLEEVQVEKHQESNSKERKECAFFRGTGCTKGNQCRFNHIQENEGVDRGHFDIKEAVTKLGECFYWRTVGCREMNNCRYAHVPEHKGVDFVKYQQHVQKARANTQESPNPPQPDSKDSVSDTGSLAADTKRDSAPSAAKSAQADMSHRDSQPKVQGSDRHSSHQPTASGDYKSKPLPSVRKPSPQPTASGDYKSKPLPSVRRPSPQPTPSGDFKPKAKAPADDTKPKSVNTRREEEFEERFEVDIDEDRLMKLIDKEFQEELTITSPTKPTRQLPHGNKPAPKLRVSPNDSRHRSAVDDGNKSGQDGRISEPSRRERESAQQEHREPAKMEQEELTPGMVVQVTYATGPNDLWLVKAENIPLLEEMITALSEECYKGTKPYHPKMNEHVAARFPDDNRWYRACVKDMHEDGTCDVLFVDYGNSSTVASSDVRKLLERFRSFPIQAHCCQLGLTPVSALGGWSEGATKAITQTLSPLVKSFRLVASTDGKEAKLVRLVDLETKQDFTKHMVESKFATVLHDKSPRPSPSRPPPNQAPRQPSSTSPMPPQLEAVPSSPQRPTPPPPLQEYPYPSQAKRQQLLPGDEVNVKVVGVVSPAQFYVVLDCKEYKQDLPELEEQMAKKYEAKTPKTTFRPNGNNMYAAKSRVDGRWHRALGYDSDFKGVAVHFVDRGGQESVPLTHIHNLDSHFLSLPFQAVCCAVSNVVPPSGSNAWNEVHCKMFTNFIFKNSYRAKIMEKDSVQLHVELITNTGDKLSDHMVNQSVGVRQSTAKSPLKQTALQTNPANSAFKSPPQMQRAADVAQHAECPRQSNQSPHTAQATSQSQAATQPCFLSSLPNGQSKVAGVYVCGPHEFYVQSAERVHINAFSDLTNEINAFYGASDRVHTPAVGELVAAFYDQDRQWFRCKVLEIEKDAVVVKFIDYGNIDRVSKRLVRRLLPDLADKPWQAIRCSLYGLTENSSQWSGRAIQQLDQLIVNNPITVTVSGSQDGFTIVEHIRDDRGRDIVQGLIDDGFLREEFCGRARAMKKQSPKPKPTQPPQTITSPKAIVTSLSQQPFPDNGSDVVISVATSPGEFYLQAASQVSDANELSKRVHYACVETCPSHRPAHVGALVAADFEGILCRAQVKKIHPGGEKFDVFFVDYGNFATVTAEELRPMPEDLKQVPGYASKCCVRDIQGTGVEGAYTTQASQWFKSTVEYVAGVTVSHEGKVSDGAYLVDLAVTGVESVSKELVAKNYAKPLHSRFQVKLAEHAKRSLPESCHVVAMEVTDDLHLYCQIATKEDAAILTEVTQHMMQYSGSTPADPAFRPATHELCVALFTFDNCWYRACVTGTPSRDTVTVLFVDFGNSETVAVTDTRPYEATCAQWPLLAVRCRLHGVDISATVDETVVQELKALALNKSLACTRLSSHGDVCEVRLETDDGSTDLNTAVQSLLPKGKVKELTMEEENALLRAQLAQLQAQRR